MSTNKSGLPDPIFSTNVLTVLMFLGAIAIIAGCVWLIYEAPCSWYSGGTVGSVPLRCVKEILGEPK